MGLNRKDMVEIMEEMIVSINSLPELLFNRMHCQHVKIREVGGLYSIEPLTDKKNISLRGFTKGSGLTVDKFLELTHEDNRLEI